MSQLPATSRSLNASALLWTGVFLIVVIAECAILVDALRFATVLLLFGTGVLVLYASVAPLTARSFVLALTLVPLLRVISIAIPVDQFPNFVWALLTGIPMFAAWFVVLQRIGLTPAGVNLTTESLPLQLAIGLIGIPLAIGIFVLLQPTYPYVATRAEGIVSFIALCAAGALDEIIFRGLLQETASVALGPWGIVYVSGLYAALQIETRSWGLVVVSFCVSLLFAWIVRRTGSVVGVILAHIVTNIGLYLILPIVGFPIGR